MIHMHNLEWAISVLGCGLLQFPHPRIVLGRRPWPLPLQGVFTPITLLDPVQEGPVARNSKPLLPGRTLEQQIDGAFRLLFQGFVVLGNVVLEQLLDALTQPWLAIPTSAQFGNETEKAMPVNGFSRTKLRAPALQGSCRDHGFFGQG